MSENDNGYRIVTLDEVPIGCGRKKGSSVWQPVIDKALANPGRAIEILLAEHPELERIPREARSGHFGGQMRRLGLQGGHLRTTSDALYIWIDPPEANNV